jgi:hypothetical protein
MQYQLGSFNPTISIEHKECQTDATIKQESTIPAKQPSQATSSKEMALLEQKIEFLEMEAEESKHKLTK